MSGFYRPSYKGTLSKYWGSYLLKEFLICAAEVCVAALSTVAPVLQYNAFLCDNFATLVLELEDTRQLMTDTKSMERMLLVLNVLVFLESLLILHKPCVCGL